tara:strand:- start:58 stop:369 length:312 start_codon:yes stop_codon:yes gene_type:complete
VDGHPLQIDELKGTKPTEKIDLSRKGLGVASAIIIASCIKGNGVLKELKCAAASRVFCQRPLTLLLPLAAWAETSSAALIFAAAAPTPPRASPSCARRSEEAP